MHRLFSDAVAINTLNIPELVILIGLVATIGLYLLYIINVRTKD